MEHPAQGGSYIRQKDGSLKRAGQVEAPATPPPASEPKPARAPRSTTKDK